MMLRYQARYRSRTRGEGWAQAALWKGGPGTMRHIWRNVDEGMTREMAISIAQSVIPLPALEEYVRRYRVAVELYEEVGCG